MNNYSFRSYDEFETRYYNKKYNKKKDYKRKQRTDYGNSLKLPYACPCCSNFKSVLNNYHKKKLKDWISYELSFSYN